MALTTTLSTHTIPIAKTFSNSSNLHLPARRPAYAEAPDAGYGHAEAPDAGYSRYREAPDAGEARLYANGRGWS